MAELEQRGDRTPIPSAWEYATAPESREIVKLRERYGIFVGGEFVEPRSGEYYETLDPSSEEPLAEIPQAGPEDVALAVESARDAFENAIRALHAISGSTNALIHLTAYAGRLDLELPLALVLSLGVALLLNQKLRGMALFRTLIYLPSVVPTVASSILWLWLLSPEIGLINTGLARVGLRGPGWLIDVRSRAPELGSQKRTVLPPAVSTTSPSG